MIRDTGPPRRDDTRVDPLVAQRRRQAQHERARRIAGLTGERVRQEENFHESIIGATGRQLVELASQFAKLRALAGDLFADQPGREKDAAED